MGPRNYFNMLKARGPRYPWDFFWQVHWFDIRRGTDTAAALPKGEYAYSSASFEHGVQYMCSWTSEVDRWFDHLSNRLGVDFANYTFVDVGCGKGKVLIAWTEALRRRHVHQQIVGIEYYAPLAELAEKNFHRCFPTDASPIVVGDALTFDFAALGDHLIVYMFNPFDDTILEEFLDRLRGQDVLLLYNNPVFDETVEQSDFVLLRASQSYHPCGTTYLYERSRQGGESAPAIERPT